MNNTNNKIQEGFADALDSSLIDYSSEFEKSDRYYQIKSWMDNFTESCLFTKTNTSIDNESHYIINDDFTINITKKGCIVYAGVTNGDGIVYVGKKAKIDGPLTDKGCLPDYINFNICEGDFAIDSWLGLKDLRGCPKYVEGTFEVTYNNLSDLKNGPIEVGLNYNIAGNYEIGKILADNGGFPDRWCNNIDMLHEKYGIPTEENFGLNVPTGNGKFIFSDPYTKNRLTVTVNMMASYKRKTKMNESFSDALDSSLIDYSSDFEKADKDYKKNQILDWLKNNLYIYKVTNVNTYAVKWKGNSEDHDDSIINDDFLKHIRINEDYTIDLIDPINSSTMFYVPGFVSDYKQAENFIIPDFIKFNICMGHFKCIFNGGASGFYKNITTLNWIPRYIYGCVYICNTNIESLEDGPIYVKLNFELNDNHNLKNFKGAPQHCRKLVWFDNKMFNVDAPECKYAVLPEYDKYILTNADAL